jgi:hypothetical protein
MVGPDEVDDMLEAETKQECSKVFFYMRPIIRQKRPTNRPTHCVPVGVLQGLLLF